MINALLLTVFAAFVRAEDVATFKKTLLGHADALSAELLVPFTPAFEKTIADLKSLQGTEVYQKCTAPKADAPKEEQSKACDKTARAMLAASYPYVRRLSGETIPEKEEALLAYIETISVAGRKELAQHSYKELADSFNRQRGDLDKSMKRLGTAVNKACIGRPMGPSIACGVEQTIAILENTLPGEMLRRKVPLEKTVATVRELIGSYSEN